MKRFLMKFYVVPKLLFYNKESEFADLFRFGVCIFVIDLVGFSALFYILNLSLRNK